MMGNIGVSLESNEVMSENLESIEVNLASTEEKMASTGGMWENIVGR